MADTAQTEPRPHPPRPAWLVTVRRVGNWANLSTELGLVVALAGRSRLRRGPRGLILAENYRLPFPIAGAFTVGDVVISCGRGWDELEQRSPGTLAHEENHTWQWALCLGLPFLPLYTAAMGWSVLRTGDRAAANWFECDADLALGGYPDAPRRPLRQGVRALLARAREPRRPRSRRSPANR